MTQINPTIIEKLFSDCIRYEDSFIKFMGSDGFYRRRKDKKLTHGQARAFRDFQQNFNQNISQVEAQLQAPINSVLTKKQIVNLYSAHIEGSFTPKEFAEKTNMSSNTARRELSSAEKRGVVERVSKGVYRYK